MHIKLYIIKYCIYSIPNTSHNTFHYVFKNSHFGTVQKLVSVNTLHFSNCFTPIKVLHQLWQAGQVLWYMVGSLVCLFSKSWCWSVEEQAVHACMSFWITNIHTHKHMCTLHPCMHTNLGCYSGFSIDWAVSVESCSVAQVLVESSPVPLMTVWW